MKNISKAKKILLFLVLLNLVVLGTYYFVFSTIKKMNEEAATLSNKTELFSQNQAIITEMEKTLEDMRPQTDELTAHFVGPNGIVSFIEEVEGVAQISGVSLDITSVEVADTEESDLKEKLNMRLDARGGWDDIYHFLSYLELMPYHLNLVRVNMLESQPAGNQSVDDEEGFSQAIWRTSLDLEVLKLK